MLRILLLLVMIVLLAFSASASHGRGGDSLHYLYVSNQSFADIEKGLKTEETRSGPQDKYQDWIGTDLLVQSGDKTLMARVEDVVRDARGNNVIKFAVKKPGPRTT